jgi:hypothetical protein
MAAAPQSPEFPWNDSLLADDVASISYERALRARARLQPAAGKQLPPAPAEKAESGGITRKLKKASITIRLSEAECEQLRQRAAEAGLTVSAYLRSCTLEVESLRAQVKQTLAEMRSAPPPSPEPATAPRSEHRLPNFFTLLRKWARMILGKRGPAIRLNPCNPFAPVRY